MQLLTRMLLYGASYAVGLILMVTVNVLRAPAYRISRKRAAVYSLITFFFGYFGAWLIGRIYHLVSGMIGGDSDITVDVIGAVIFTSPLVLAAVFAEKAFLKSKRTADADGSSSAALKAVNFRDTLDLMITGAFFMFASIKIGCAFRGCCWGVECSWGFMSPYIHKTVFPIQVFEAATLLFIIIVCYYIKQTPFFRRGMAGPLNAFMYGAARFFWEFLRWYTPEMRHIALGLTLWQMLCILIVIVAGIWIFILYKTQPSEPLPKSKLYLKTESLLKRKTKKAEGKARPPIQHKKRKKK